MTQRFKPEAPPDSVYQEKIDSLERQLAQLKRDLAGREKLLEESERQGTEAALRDLARFPDENPYPILRFSAEGAILYANPASQDLLKIWGCCDSDSTPEFVREIVRESLETGRVRQVELEVGSRSLKFTFAPILEALYVNAYAADITEQKRLLESIDDGFFALDREWRFTYINRPAARIGQQAPQSYLGKSIWDLWPELRGTVVESNYRRAMDEAQPAYFRTEGILSENWYDVSAYPSGEGISVFFFNRTESIRAEEALRRFELLSANSRDIILFIRGDDGRILEANAAAEKAYGYSREELLEMAIRDLRAPETLGLTDEQMAQADSGGILFETVHRRKDGSAFPVDVSSQGATIGGARMLISIIRDITQRKRMEAALRESEIFAKKVLAASLNGLYLFDLSLGKITYINPRYTELTGLSLETLQAMSAEEFLARFHPEDRPRVEAHLEAVKNARNGEIFEIEYRFRNAGGRWIWAYSFDSVFSRDVDGSPSLQIGTFIDITARKQAEEALLHSEERFSKAFLANPNALVISRLENGLILDVNESFEKLFGYPYEEVIGKTSLQFNMFANPLDRERAVQRLREEKALRDFEVEIRTRFGEIRQVSLSADVLTIGGELCLITIIHDITEKKLAEDALRQSEERYRNLFESIDEGFCVIEVIFDENEKPVDYRFLEINPAFERQTGIENAIGRRMREIAPQHEEYWFETYGKIAVTGETMRFEEYAEQLQRHYEVYAFRVGEPVRRNVAVLFNDITERKRAEETLLTYTAQLRRSNQALEDFAFIASHDLQEPLRKIQAFGDSLQQSSDNLNERQREYVNRMRGAAGRMEQMVDDLLALSRVTTQGQPFKPVDLSKVAEGVLSDLEMQIHRTGGKVILSGLPVVEADPFQMRQLLQNLIGNALKYHRPGVPPVVKVYSQGIGDQGSGTSDRGLGIEGQGPTAHSWSLVPDHLSLVTIVIEDNGIGFDESQVERIFQPFQRLVGKSQYEGNGIGLAIVQKIVERHNGRITARSRRGQGSTFIVSLQMKPTSSKP